MQKATGKSRSVIFRELKIARGLTPEDLQILEVCQDDLTVEDLVALAGIEDPAVRSRVIHLTTLGLTVAEAILEAARVPTPEEVASEKKHQALKAEKELSSRDWLEGFCSKIRPYIQEPRQFDREALLWRRDRQYRQSHKLPMKEAVLDVRDVQWGPYSDLLYRLFYVAHPGDWWLCGTCQGKNKDLPQCQDCQGNGFKLKTEHPKK
jgi:hypothetical protein